MSNVNTWDGLTATLWNNLLWNVETLKTDVTTLQTNTTWITSVAWKVWIWVPTATEKLDVAGTVKATQVNSSKAAFVRVKLNQCSWYCSGNHTLNTWTNIGSYTHSVNNNDTDTFSTNTTWTVTINKSWTYMIRINMMEIPVADGTSQYALPYINWSVNSLWSTASEQAPHAYRKAWYWSTSIHTFVWNINAWSTVWYAYYPVQTLTYWGIDDYTGMEIIKLN